MGTEGQMFKVWCKEYNEWESEPCMLGQDGELYQLFDHRRGWIKTSKAKHIVCFRTPFYDIKTTPIFDGDIIGVRKNILGVEKIVYWNEKEGRFKARDASGHGADHGLDQEWITEFEIVVVGNIHEVNS